MKTLISTALAMLLLATPALANGNGNAGVHCPPGLAKKNPPCVPPGQARHGVTTSEWLARHRIGGIADDPRILTDIDDLPRLISGEVYAILDNALIRMDPETREILELIRILNVVLN